MIDPADSISFVVLGVMGYRLVDGMRHARSTNGRNLVTTIVRGIRWRHVWPIPFVLASILLAAWPLLLVPGLDWGWWSALGGDGNPVFGSSSATIGTVFEWAIPLAFIALLVPALPLFAHAEERMFRTGAEEWSQAKRAVKVVQFGLVHALIGIPIGAALALSIGGAYFMAVYLRSFAQVHDSSEATLDSARAHTAYNGAIIVIVLVAALIGALA
jgi:hypothetical protein